MSISLLKSLAPSSILIRITILPTLLPLLPGTNAAAVLAGPSRITSLEDERPRLPLLAPPLAASFTFYISQRPRMLVPRIRVRAEAEAALHAQANVACKVFNIPQRVRLALEQRNQNSGVG